MGGNGTLLGDIKRAPRFPYTHTLPDRAPSSSSKGQTSNSRPTALAGCAPSPGLSDRTR